MLRLFFLGMMVGAALMAMRVVVFAFQVREEPAPAAARCEMKHVEIDGGYGVSAVELREVCSG